jgi:hypothetical protein
MVCHHHGVSILAIRLTNCVANIRNLLTLLRSAFRSHAAVLHTHRCRSPRLYGTLLDGDVLQLLRTVLAGPHTEADIPCADASVIRSSKKRQPRSTSPDVCFTDLSEVLCS